jgi:hypothetical protein
MSTYEQNRASIPPAELRQYCGQWVAFGLDGSRVLAGAETLRQLEEQLAAAGEDPQQVAFERIEPDDSLPGGAEFL